MYPRLAMTPHRWSSRILSDLALVVPIVAAGCATAAGPQPETGPPTSSAGPVATASTPVQAPRGVLADPPGTPPGITEIVELVKADKRDEPVGGDHVRTVSFGRGIFSHYGTLELPRGEVDSCPFMVKPGDPCQFFRVAPAVKPRDLTTAAHPQSASDVGAWGKLEPTKQDWSAFSPGKDRVYAVRRNHQLAIDTIDEKGVVSIFTESLPSMPALHDVHVIESASAVIVVAENENEDLVLTSVKTDAAGKAVGSWVMNFLV